MSIVTKTADYGERFLDEDSSGKESQYLAPVIDLSIFRRGGDAAQDVLDERVQRRNNEKRYGYFDPECEATRASANPHRWGMRHVPLATDVRRPGQREPDMRRWLPTWALRISHKFEYVPGEGRAASADALLQEMTQWAAQRNDSYPCGRMLSHRLEETVAWAHAYVLQSKIWNSPIEVRERTPEEEAALSEKQRWCAQQKRTVTRASIAAARTNGGWNSLATKAEQSEEVADLLTRAQAMESRDDRWAAAEKLSAMTGLTAEHIFKRNLATPKSQARDAQATHRAEILAYVEQGHSQRAAGRHFGVSEAAIRKHVKRARQDRQEGQEQTMDSTPAPSQPEAVSASQESAQQASGIEQSEAEQPSVAEHIAAVNATIRKMAQPKQVHQKQGSRRRRQRSTGGPVSVLDHEWAS